MRAAATIAGGIDMVVPFAAIFGQAEDCDRILMSGLQVLLVAGTHGNEINAPWLLDKWSQTPELINTHGVGVVPVIGNPEALALGRRYLDCDLNRSFRLDLLRSPSILDREVVRAKQLLSFWSRGINPLPDRYGFAQHHFSNGKHSCGLWPTAG